MLELAPPTIVLDRWADAATLTARILDQSGNVMAGQGITLTSSDSTIVRVSGTGHITSWRDGVATITANSGTFEATAEVTVVVQRNAACTIPGAPAERGPAAPPINYVAAMAGPPSPEGGFNMALPLDVDRDGHLDILFAYNDPWDASTYNWFQVYLNQGDGTFVIGEPAMVFDGPSPFNGPRDHAYLDVNGDGLLDVYIAQPGFDPPAGCGHSVVCPGAPNVLLVAQPGGGFRDMAPTSLVPYATNGFTHSGDVADIDCDGDEDLFEAQLSNADATAPNSLKLNTGGIFVDASNRLPPEAMVGPLGSLFCDLDQDGDPDLILGNRGGEVFVNDGFGHFRFLPDLFPEPRPPKEFAHGSDMACADLTGNGFPDIVYHDHSWTEHDGKWTIIMNQGGMQFEDGNHLLPDPEGWYGFPPGGGTTIIQDLNQDGWPDLITGSNRDPLRVLWNTGGNFITTELRSITDGVHLGSVVGVGDFDGDGRPDLWVQNNVITILFAR